MKRLTKNLKHASVQFLTMLMLIAVFHGICSDAATVLPVVHDRYFVLLKNSGELDGALNEMVEFTHNFVKTTFDWERAVRSFRDHVDASPTGQNWNGEFWGKLMRGSCILYEHTQDEALYATLENAVRGLLATQKENGRISSFTDDMEMKFWDLWCQKYVLLGLQYFHGICRDETLKKEILTALCREADYIMTKIGKDPGQISIVDANPTMRGLPESSILEPMVRMYNLTGDRKYLDFSKYIIDSGGTNAADIFQLALDGKVYPYQYPIYPHGYAMMACFEGLIEYYRVTGEEKYLQSIKNFYRLLKESDVTVIGATGAAFECLNNATIKQTDLAVAQGLIQELCGASTWVKLNYQLLRLLGDSSYVDEIELTAYNALLGSVHFEMEPGQSPFDAFTPLINGVRGRFAQNLGFCNCCVASTVSGKATLTKINMMQSDTGFAMNLYMPSVINAASPSGKPVEVITATGYPYTDGKITITVNPQVSETFDIDLRIPGWSKDVQVTVNGEPVAIIPGTYAKITSEWVPGDFITLCFDMRPRIIAAPDGKGIMEALVRGPIVLARDKRFGEGLGAKSITRDADEYVVLTPSNTGKFATRLEFEVPVTEGDSFHFHVADFASVGSTWSSESRYSVWLSNRDTVNLDTDKTYTLVPKASRRMAWVNGDGILDKTVKSPSSGGDISPFCFELEEVGTGGMYRISQNGKYLTVDPDKSSTSGAKIKLLDRMDSNLQLWWLIPVTGNGFNIINLESGQSISESGTDDGLHQWVHIGGSNLQIWLLQEPDF